MVDYNCKHVECVVWYPNREECDDCVDGRLIELVSEYASTCDGCGDMTHHDILIMDVETQLGYCIECVQEIQKNKDCSIRLEVDNEIH